MTLYRFVFTAFLFFSLSLSFNLNQAAAVIVSQTGNEKNEKSEHSSEVSEETLGESHFGTVDTHDGPLAVEENEDLELEGPLTPRSVTPPMGSNLDSSKHVITSAKIQHTLQATSTQGGDMEEDSVGDSTTSVLEDSVDLLTRSFLENLIRDPHPLSELPATVNTSFQSIRSGTAASPEKITRLNEIYKPSYFERRLNAIALLLEDAVNISSSVALVSGTLYITSNRYEKYTRVRVEKLVQLLTRATAAWKLESQTVDTTIDIDSDSSAASKALLARFGSMLRQLPEFSFLLTPKKSKFCRTVHVAEFQNLYPGIELKDSVVRRTINQTDYESVLAALYKIVTYDLEMEALGQMQLRMFLERPVVLESVAVEITLDNGEKKILDLHAEMVLIRHFERHVPKSGERIFLASSKLFCCNCFNYLYERHNTLFNTYLVEGTSCAIFSSHWASPGGGVQKGVGIRTDKHARNLNTKTPLELTPVKRFKPDDEI